MFAFKKNLLLLLAVLCFSTGFAGQKKVALLFLTIGDVNHPQFWTNYLKGKLDKYNIYIHSKVGVRHYFFSKFKTSRNVPTEWAYTVNARKILLEEAFRNPENYKFVMLTESCIPLVDPATLYEKLTENDSSMISWCNPWWNEENERELVELPKQHRKVNDSTFILNRHHTEICLRDTKVTKIITNHPVDSEAFPSPILSVYGCLDEVENKRPIFVDWERCTGAHPYQFKESNSHDSELILKAQADGYLFARKFAASYPDEDFYRWTGVKQPSSLKRGNRRQNK